MHLLEALESRTLLADTTGFAASASLALDPQSVSVRFTSPLSNDPSLQDIHLIDRSTGQPLSIPLSLNVSTDLQTRRTERTV